MREQRQCPPRRLNLVRQFPASIAHPLNRKKKAHITKVEIVVLKKANL